MSEISLAIWGTEQPLCKQFRCLTLRTPYNNSLVTQDNPGKQVSYLSTSKELRSGFCNHLSKFYMVSEEQQ